MASVHPALTLMLGVDSARWSPCWELRGEAGRSILYLGPTLSWLGLHLPQM